MIAFKALAVAILITWGGGALLFFVVLRRVVNDPSQIPLSYIIFCTIMTVVQGKYIYDIRRGNARRG
jgi:hypothetical protein